MRSLAAAVVRTAAALVLAVVCLGGCSARGDLGRREKLDEATGVTIMRARAPIVFARAETRYSVSGRDYLYLAPVETDRQGVHEYFLWVGAATTLDRGYIAPSAAPPEALYLRVRGEWMRLELGPWTERVPDPAAARPYRTPVQTRTELAARVTLDQLDLMAREPLESIRVVDAAGRTTDYARWDKGPAWPGFGGQTAGAP